jgi:hypothetical protein
VDELAVLFGRRLGPKGIRLARTLFQASNNIRGGFSVVDPSHLIKIDIYHPSPFGCHIDTSLSTLVGPPIEPHEEILIWKDMTILNGRSAAYGHVTFIDSVLSVPDVSELLLPIV